MKTYYVSFTIADDAGYSDRYDALMDLLRGYSNTIWWTETTSFVMFQSELTGAQIAADIEQVINTSKDIAVLAATHFKVMLVIGANKDDDIYRLVDFAKKA